MIELLGFHGNGMVAVIELTHSEADSSYSLLFAQRDRATWTTETVINDNQ